MGYDSWFSFTDKLEKDEVEKFRKLDELILSVKTWYSDPLQQATFRANLETIDFYKNFLKHHIKTEPLSLEYYWGYDVDDDGTIHDYVIEDYIWPKRYDYDILAQAIAYSLNPGRVFRLIYEGEDRARYGGIIVKSKSGKVFHLPISDDDDFPSSGNWKITHTEFNEEEGYEIYFSIAEEDISIRRLQNLDKVVKQLCENGFSNKPFAKKLLNNFSIEEIQSYSTIEEIDGAIDHDVPDVTTVYNLVNNINVHAFLIANSLRDNATSGKISIITHLDDALATYNRITLSLYEGKVEKEFGYLTFEYGSKKYIYGTEEAKSLIDSLINS